MCVGVLGLGSVFPLTWLALSLPLFAGIDKSCQWRKRCVFRWVCPAPPHLSHTSNLVMLGNTFFSPLPFPPFRFLTFFFLPLVFLLLVFSFFYPFHCGPFHYPFFLSLHRLPFLLSPSFLFLLSCSYVRVPFLLFPAPATCWILLRHHHRHH